MSGAFTKLTQRSIQVNHLGRVILIVVLNFSRTVLNFES